MIINFFVSQTGRSPVQEFIKSLNKQDKAKVLGCLQSIQELGLDCPRVEFRQIEGKLWEIKVRTQAGGYRFFYITIKKEVMVLLHAYKKQSQKAPKNEIEIALKRLKEVLKNDLIK